MFLTALTMKRYFYGARQGRLRGIFARTIKLLLDAAGTAYVNSIWNRYDADQSGGIDVEINR